MIVVHEGGSVQTKDYSLRGWGCPTSSPTERSGTSRPGARRAGITLDLGATRVVNTVLAHELIHHAAPSGRLRATKAALYRRGARVHRIPRAHWPKIWSTNPLERVNKEI